VLTEQLVGAVDQMDPHRDIMAVRGVGSG
jgi:hypothetical protein